MARELDELQEDYADLEEKLGDSTNSIKRLNVEADQHLYDNEKLEVENKRLTNEVEGLLL